MVFSLVALSLTTGTASASGLPPVYGFQTSDGHFVLPWSQGLLSANPLTPGSTVFGDTIYLQITPNGANGTVHLTTVQRINGAAVLWYNATYAVDALAVTTVQFDLPSSVDQTDTSLCVDSGCVAFLHLTPVTLIPSGVLNIGGLDLLILSMVVLTAALAFPLALLARWLTRRALWSPKFRAWLWAPHIIGLVVFGVFIDYQAFDAFFGGLAFVWFPIDFDLLFFAWMLHLFNVAKPVEVLRPDPQGGHRLRYNRWRIWVGQLPDGTKILVGTRWRDWWARLMGHYPVLVAADVDGTRSGPPAEAPLLTLRSETRAERTDRRTRLLRKRYRATGNRDSPLDDFVIAGDPDHKEKDPPTLLYWVDSDRWLSTDMPYLSFHREVKVPAKRNAEGVEIEPATTRQKWSLPHYIDPPTEAGLADAHYIDAPVFAVGWGTIERLTRRLTSLRTNNVALKTTVITDADDMAQTQVAEVYRLFGREREPMNEDEAAEDMRSDAPKPPPNPDATASEASGSPAPGKEPERRLKGGRP